MFGCPSRDLVHQVRGGAKPPLRFPVEPAPTSWALPRGDEYNRACGRLDFYTLDHKVSTLKCGDSPFFDSPLLMEDGRLALINMNGGLYELMVTESGLKRIRARGLGFGLGPSLLAALKGQRLMVRNGDCSVEILDPDLHIEWEYFNPERRLVCVPAFLDSGRLLLNTDNAILAEPAASWTPLPAAFEREYFGTLGQVPLGEGARLYASDRHDYLLQYDAKGSVTGIKALRERPGRKVITPDPSTHLVGLPGRGALVMIEGEGVYLLDLKGELLKSVILEAGDLCPCFDGVRLYIPVLGNNELHCFDARLETQWIYKCPVEMASSPVCTTEGIVLYCDEEDWLIGLDGSSGQLISSDRLPEPCWLEGLMICGENALLAAGTDGSVMLIR